MIINTPGEYTLQYTATDACGNTTTVERKLVVEGPPRTVLYTDGTLIINELSRDIASNIAQHGQPTNVYIPLDSNSEDHIDRYEFIGISETPWYNQRNSIINVEIGSEIHPTDMKWWFGSLSNCISIDLSNIDSRNVVSMYGMCALCTSLENINLNVLDTSNVDSMAYMFNNCQAIETLDLSGFDTSDVSEMNFMFNNCQALTTIYVSSLFVVTQVTQSTSMFQSTQNIVGGAGTTWSGNNPQDKTYAHIDGGVSDPGYFTAKS